MASDLKDLKSSKITVAEVKHENVPGSGADEHHIRWTNTLADPWKGWEDAGNRIESSWHRYPSGMLSSKAKPFPVQAGAVSGSGDLKFEWTTWTDSTKLKNHHVELYSVMRAEHRYISKGYKKIASKYFYWRPIGGGRVIPVENCGIDSFFEKGGQYVICESKFTRDEGKFAQWKVLKPWGSNKSPPLPPRPVHYNVWQMMGKYTAGRKKCRQMSWDWIEDRAKKAVKSPAPRAPAGSPAAAAVAAEVRDMAKAVRYSSEVERVVNVFGAAQVPIYPGWYEFVCAELSKLSSNCLHLKWTLDIADDEFALLDHYFDKWAEENR